MAPMERKRPALKMAWAKRCKAAARMATSVPRPAVITISPLKHNWALKFLSHEIYTDIRVFEEALVSGALARRIEEVLGDV